MAARSMENYLQPSGLCDFDRHPEIGSKASDLAAGCGSEEEAFRRLSRFVKELPYGLEDWDVAASQTLAKGWGMCLGKANLLIALLRSLSMPCRYRVLRTRTEMGLWQSVTSNGGMAARLGPAPAEQDHVDCEIWLGEWRVSDPARDTAMERGMKALGLPLEREYVVDSLGRPVCLRLDRIDDWARERQQMRRVRDDREEVFARVNEQLWRIRAFARHGS